MLVAVTLLETLFPLRSQEAECAPTGFKNPLCRNTPIRDTWWYLTQKPLFAIGSKPLLSSLQSERLILRRFPWFPFPLLTAIGPEQCLHKVWNECQMCQLQSGTSCSRMWPPFRTVVALRSHGPCEIRDWDARQWQDSVTMTRFCDNDKSHQASGGRSLWSCCWGHLPWCLSPGLIKSDGSSLK